MKLSRQRTAVLAVLCIFSSLHNATASGPYNTTGGRNAEALNVHIVCHSHCDPGWLKTVDQYHYGSNSSIQVAGTAYILDSIVQSLLADPSRKFIFAEMAFFTRWWNEQSNDTHGIVHQLVREGQLDFVNGGWAQNDEAASHYVAMVDQTTRGHRFLMDTFGKVPKVGWQIDPFGHSATTPGLAGLYGFDALFFGRADYQDMKIRAAKQQMEVLWQGTSSYGSDGGVFTGNFLSGNYGPPPGFNWDWGQGDPPLQDDSALYDYNVDNRIDAFVEECTKIFNATRGNDIMLTMGSDFQYANSHVWYKNLDKLIHYTKLDGRLNVFYSTPEAYVGAKHDSDIAWPVKTDDFFPYADCPHCYWTGYFTSRAADKGYIRCATSYLQAARQLEAHLGATSGGPSTDRLEAAVSVTQHHDAITGTAKQHVSNDYMKRITAGLVEAQEVVAAALEQRFAPDSAASAASQPYRLQHCGLLNISVCGATVGPSGRGEGFSVALYNPLAGRRREAVRLPLGGGSRAWAVEDEEGKAVVSQLVPVRSSTRQLQDAAVESGALPDLLDAAGKWEIIFLAELPPLGFASYSVKPSQKPGGRAVSSAVRTLPADGIPARECMLGSGPVRVQLNAAGRPVALQKGSNKVELDVSMWWYLGSDGNTTEDEGIASGAYIFRPDGAPHQLNGTESDAEQARSGVEVAEGPLVIETHETYADWASVTMRFWQFGNGATEIEWTVGPIPIDDDRGKEVVLKYATDLPSGDTFYTDANGREYQKRVRNWRPTWDLNVTEPVAGNFYPLTAGMFIQGPEAAVTLLTDRSQGGASLSGGEVEVMLHRRLLHDDRRGVAEPLNETACGCRDCDCDGLIVRGRHLLLVDPIEEAAPIRRAEQQRLNDPLVMAFGPLLPTAPRPSAALHRAGVLGSKDWEGLPPNVHLMTLKEVDDGVLLLRLAHLFQVGEDEDLSMAAEVDLRDLLPAGRIGRVTEMTLGGAVPRRDVSRLSWQPGEHLSSTARSQQHRHEAAGDAGGQGSTAQFHLGDSSGQEESGSVSPSRRLLGHREGAADPAPTEPTGAMGLSTEILDCSSECDKCSLVVTLNAMEIRTFEVVLSKHLQT